MKGWIETEAEKIFEQNPDYKVSLRDLRNRLRFWVERKFDIEISKKALSGAQLMRPLVIHIVKRFGRVGGMETYVWNLVHGLILHGQRVAVVCEEILEQPARTIQIFEVNKGLKRPRWKSMMCFRDNVQQLITEQFTDQLVLIHSHERSLYHQVSTFHGPSIKSGTRAWLSKFSKRISAWQKLESDELLADNVQVVLSVSSRVQKDLKRHYPQIEGKIWASHGQVLIS